MATLAGLASNAPSGARYAAPTQNLSYFAQPAAPNHLMQIEQARGGGDNNDTATAANFGNAAGPQGAPGAAAAPKLTDYAAQYEAALGSQRATIAHQIASALADMNQQEAGARQAVGLLPGQLNQVYDTGNASMAQSAGALDAAQKASGLTSYMGAGAQMAPVQGAITADRAARQADVPLLNIGLAQAAAAQHAALQQASLGAYGQVDQQQAQFALAQQQAQQAAQQHIADQQFSAQQQQTGADLSLRNTLAAQQASAGATDPFTLQSLHAQQTNIDKAGFGGQFTAPQAIAIRDTPQYKFIASNGLQAAYDYNRLHPNDPAVHTLFQVLKADGKLPMNA